MTLLLVLPLCTMAQWRSTSGYSQPRQQQERKKSAYNEPMVTLGLHHTVDFYKRAAGVGLGLMVDIGRYKNLVTFTTGVEFIEYLGGDPRPESEANGLGVVSAGGQVVIPATLRLQLFATSKETKFYIACGGELGFKAHEGGVLKHLYPDDKALHSTTTAFIPMVGWKSRLIDFGVYYKHYLTKPFYNTIGGKHNLGDEKARIGYFLTCYF